MTGKRGHQLGKGTAAPSLGAPWLVHFFKRHAADDPAAAVPARDFLDRCPTSVAAKMIAVVKAVAEAPPPAFSGGGKWEAMHGEMSGFYEIRVDGPKRHHYRLFCMLERDECEGRPRRSELGAHHGQGQAVSDRAVRSRLRGGSGPRSRVSRAHSKERGEIIRPEPRPGRLTTFDSERARDETQVHRRA